MDNTEVKYTLILAGLDRLESGLKDAKRHSDTLADGMGNLKRTIIEAFAVREIYEFGKELLNLTSEFQGFDNVIKYSSLNTQDYNANINFLKQSVKDLHLPLKETYQSFSEMQAGMLGTGIEGQKLRDLFYAISEGAATLHLAPQSFSNLTFALKEIGELGTLQARQLRMLAFALPGSVTLAAKAMGMTTEQLHKAMEKGAIQSADFLPKFTKVLDEHFRGGVENFSHSLIANMNDAKTAMIQSFLDLGTALEPVFVRILQNVKVFFDGLKAGIDYLAAHKHVLVDIALAIGGATTAWIAFTFWENRAMIAGALNEIQIFASMVATDGLSAALYAAGVAGTVMWGALTLGISIAIPAIYEAYRHFEGFRNVVNAVWATLKPFVEFLWKDLVFVFTTIYHLLGAIGFALSGRFSDAADHMKAIVSNFKELGSLNDSTKTGITSPADKLKGVSGSGIGAGSGSSIGIGNQSDKVTGTRQVIINVSINKLVETIKIMAQNIKDGANQAGPHVAEALLSAVNQFSASADI